MQYALGDGSTLNEVCEAQAIVMELPLLRDVLKPVPLLPHGEEGAIGGAIELIREKVRVTISAA
jgi:hypothetical protein